MVESTRSALKSKALATRETTKMASETLTQLLLAESPRKLNASGAQMPKHAHLDTQIRISHPCPRARAAGIKR